LLADWANLIRSIRLIRVPSRLSESLLSFYWRELFDPIERLSSSATLTFPIRCLSAIVFTVKVSFNLEEFMFKSVLIFVLVLCSSACSLMTREAPTEDVDKAAILFFERLKAGKFDLIYTDSAKSFQEKNPKVEVFENLKKMKELGQPDTPVRASMILGEEEGKRSAMPTYYLHFDQTRTTVILKFLDYGGEWKLGAFEVRQRPQ
jgi:hypothetical protein